MMTTLITIGIVCIIAAIVGGGLSAFQIEIPVLSSLKRQIILGVFGLILIVSANWTTILKLSNAPQTPGSTDSSAQYLLSADLSSKMDSIRNQGTENSAVGFALADMMHYAYLKFKNENIQFSPRYIYNEVRAMDSNLNSDVGMDMEEGIQLLIAKGAVAETEWPYKFGESANNEPPNVKNAYHYKLKNYTSISVSLQTFKDNLSSGFPIIAGIEFYQPFLSSETAKTGILPLVNLSDSKVSLRGLVIVGYDDQKGLLKFKNTWGTSWGNRGYGYIQYKDAINIISVAYIFTEVE